MMQPDIEFEWNEAKAAINLKKHGVAFYLAETVFDVPYARVIDDPDHSDEEERLIIIGYATTHQLLFVSFATHGKRIRLIGARPATRQERRLYEQKND